MFDTSVVRPHAMAAPRRVTLVASILIHSVVVAGAIALTISATELPKDPPKQMELYRTFDPPAAPPQPLGRPDGKPPEQKPAPKPKQASVPPAPQQVVAPEVIPDAVPEVAQTPGQNTPGPIGTSDEPLGSRFGDPNVPYSDQPIIDAPSGPGPSIHTAGVGGVTPPKVITRVEPRFPPALVHGIRSATVIVRCIIGSDGRIRDPEIVMSSFTPFNESVLTALNQWRFEPGKLRGQAVDTWFELKVQFQVR